MSLKPWKILKSRYLRPGFRIDKCELPNGKIFNPYVIEFNSWANVLALTKNNQAVLVKQYRHGVQDFLLELPGGVVDEGEDPLVGIQRELLDETEEIEVHLMPLEELIAMAKKGEFPQALHVAVLFQAIAYMEKMKK